MGWFSNPKCPIHGIEYKIDKDYMCQMYYFCPKCRSKRKADNKLKTEIEELKRKIQKIENKF